MTNTIDLGWIASVTALCTTHGVEESWAVPGASYQEALDNLDNISGAIEDDGHELETWEPRAGKVFPLPEAPREVALGKTPSEITLALRTLRRDFEIYWSNTGGNVWCIIAERLGRPSQSTTTLSTTSPTTTTLSTTSPTTTTLSTTSSRTCR